MKNFLFPQIFQPVLVDDTDPFNYLSQKIMTSRRIQTEFNIIDDKSNPLKLSDPLGVQLTHQKDQEQTIKDESNRQGTKTKFSLKPSKMALASNRGNSEIKIDQNKSKTFRQKKANIVGKNFSISNDQKLKQDEIQKLNRTSQQNNLQKKNILQKIEKSQTQNSQCKEKNKKYLIKNRKTERSSRKNHGKSSKLQTQSLQDPAALQKQQEELARIAKAKQQQEQEQLAYKKRLLFLKNFPGRRYGMQSRKQFDFQMTQEMAKIMRNNTMLSGGDSPSNPFRQGTEFFSCDSKRTLNLSENKIVKNMGKNKNNDQLLNISFQTCHQLDYEPRESDKHRRTFTIWDIGSNSSSQHHIGNKKSKYNQDGNQQDGKTGKTLKSKKTLKKVRFVRTSIDEDKENENKAKLSKRMLKDEGKSNTRQFTIKRSSTNKGLISINNIIDDQTEAQKKNLQVKVNQIKKSNKKLKKNDMTNVYNDLNFFRLKLNMAQAEQEEEVTGKKIPETILLSVERVKPKNDTQRLEQARISNMMIDFGVRVTRDCTLRQLGARDRAICMPI